MLNLYEQHNMYFILYFEEGSCETKQKTKMFEKILNHHVRKKNP